MTSALLESLLLLGLAAHCGSSVCNQRPVPTIHGADAEAISLAGCRRTYDPQEVLYDMRDDLWEASTSQHISKWQEHYQLFQSVLKDYGSQYGFDGYKASAAIYLQEASVHGGLLARKDEEIMKKMGYTNFCESPLIGCERINGETHVVSLAHFMKSEEDWTTLSGLRHLRALSLVAMLAGKPDKLDLPALEVLELRFDNRNKKFMEQFLANVLGKFTNLHVLAVVPGKYKYFNWNLQALCGLTELRDLYLADMNVHAIPDCFSKFRELRNVYLSCNYLKEAPRALAGLPQLRSFIAFRQGEWTPCHFGFQKLPRLLKGVHMDKDCKFTWETKSGLDGDDNPRVLCRPYAIQGTVQDFMDLGWRKLEKLWLDGNFMSGNIPEGLPKAWPNLSSLDLYNNDLTGEIPSSLSSLPFVKLQLHDNQLSGKVPHGLMKLPACQLNLAANKGLEGCAPKYLVHQRQRVSSQGWEGTRTKVCDEGEL